MFTSRAEYRLLLREDNADLRLTEIGRGLGLVDEARWRAFSIKQEAIAKETARLQALWLHVSSSSAEQLRQRFGFELSKDQTALEVLKRPEVDYTSLCELEVTGPAVSDPLVGEQVEIAAKYAGYLQRQQLEIDKSRKHETTGLPADLDYAQVAGLSSEVRQKLNQHRPTTLGQAARIAGITPAAISLLMVHLKRYPQAASA